MYCVRNVTSDLYWVGANDHRLALFENCFPIPRGVSYNAYCLLDEKTVLFDTVDWSACRQLLENLNHVLNGRELDYLLINHLEPDHAACIEEILLRHPKVKVISNEKAFMLMRQFGFHVDDHECIEVKEGDTFSFGRHTVTFVGAPMVHWPEAMVTFDVTDGVLFSADAFGSFGAVDGNIFADEIDDKGTWLSEARRYYTNIVGKFGMSVQGLLKKAAGLEIRMICPLHSVIWREDLPWLIDKYLKWSSYTPEEKSVTIAYGSVYGHTEKAADILAGKLADRGIRHISVFDVSRTHPSYIIADAFRTSAMVFASITYNGGIFCNMDTLLHQLAAHGLTNRTAALIQNGTWAATTSKQMGEILGTMKNIHVLEADVTIKSALKDNQEAELDALADAIAASLQ
mgnify:CR=1 FL=1